MIWYALNVARQKEFVAEQILRDKGYVVRVPVIHTQRRRPHRRAKTKLLQAVPHFPGWVFIGFHSEAERDWEALRRIKLVQGVFSPTGEPLCFPDAMIIQIMHDFDQRPIRQTKEARKKYRSGILAEVISGPYQAGEGEPPRRVRVAPIPHGIPTLVEVFAPSKAA